MKSRAFSYRVCLGLLLMSLLALPWPVSAGEKTMDGYQEITAFELKQMLDSGQRVVVVNVLSEIEFNCQHISGSINIPIVKMRDPNALPQDRNTPLVFHCLSER
ncbi:MAG: hypothetical protein HY885_03530 [Deltaproteobacteria bacterium]|nr:hypothetical protein [Deltaproteobacteria bacterium]